MEQQSVFTITEKQIGDTLYIIESAVSKAAKETAYDKLKRLILSDTEVQKYPDGSIAKNA